MTNIGDKNYRINLFKEESKNNLVEETEKKGSNIFLLTFAIENSN